MFRTRDVTMDKQKKEVKEKAIEVTLWDAANKLRGSVEPAEYKRVVLGLIFLKFTSDKFEVHRQKLIADGKEKYVDMPDFYNMANVFYLDEDSRWSFIVKKAKQPDISLIIDTALHNIEKRNKALKVNKVKGVDFTRKMQALVERYNQRDENDILRSEVYEEMAEQLTNMIWEVHKEFSAGAAMGIDFEEKAFYDILKELCVKYDFTYPEDKMIALAKAVKDLVDSQARYPDWNKRDDIKSALKVGLILLLDEHGYPPVERDEVYVEIFEQTENFKKFKS